MTPEQKAQLIKALAKGHIEQLIEIKKRKKAISSAGNFFRLACLQPE